MDGPPNTVLPPLKSSQLGATEAANALTRSVNAGSSEPANAIKGVRTGALTELAPLTHTQAPEKEEQPVQEAVIPDGEMTLAQLSDCLEKRVRPKQSEDVVDEADEENEADNEGDAEWSTGSYLRKYAPQKRKAGAGLAGAALGKMHIT